MVRVYPPSDKAESETLDEVLENLERGDKIRIQVAGGSLEDAVYEERGARSIYVREYVWKKQIIGKKRVLGDDRLAIAIADIEQLHAVRVTTTEQIVAFAVGSVFLVGFAWLMTGEDQSE
jgi:hypothetical protein